LSARRFDGGAEAFHAAVVEAGFDACERAFESRSG
jgi:hypothetical protein